MAAEEKKVNRTKEQQEVLNNIIECLKFKGIDQKDLCEHLGKTGQMFTNWNNGTVNSFMKYLPQIAGFLDIPVAYLYGKSDKALPQSEQVLRVLPYEKRGKRPIIGITSAGTGIIADEMIIGWQSVDEAYDSEDFFWLQIAGDSMAPKIDNGDLVLIQRDTEIEDGCIAVVIVDGTDGFIKQIHFKDDKVILHSFNPYYPDLEFEGERRKDLAFIGRARKVERDL